MAWHTVKETATLLGCSPITVYRWCAAGAIRHGRIGVRGGHIIISDEAIAAFLKWKGSRRVPPGTLRGRTPGDS